MQKLHLVGFTPERDGLILSVRKGAKSGKYVVAVDADVLRQLGESARAATPAPAARANGLRPGHGPRTTRPESQLSPREMQDLLRAGWTLEEVAAEAGVDVDWVSRFASPVLAEMHLILEQARALTFDKPRVGPSALPLASSVRRNAAERGVRFTDEDFDSAWRAHQLDELTWIVGFDYESRGRGQTAEWTLHLETDELAARNRLGGQLGHVQSARRRVDTAAPPKPKPKAGASKQAARARSTRATPVKAAAKKRKATTPAKKKPARPRAGEPTATTPAASPATGTARPSDPYRDQLRRRLAESAPPRAAEPAATPTPTSTATPAPPTSTATPAPPTTRDRAPVRTPEPAAARAPAPPRAVPILGPSVRSLGRRPPRPAPAVTEPVAPPLGNHGPLPPPEPLPVPPALKERVATPLGTIEEPEPDDDHEPSDLDVDDEVDDAVEVEADDAIDEVEDEEEPDLEAAEDELAPVAIDLVDADDDDLAELELEIPEPPRPRPVPATPTFRGVRPAAAAPPQPTGRRRRSEPLRAR